MRTFTHTLSLYVYTYVFIGVSFTFGSDNEGIVLNRSGLIDISHSMDMFVHPYVSTHNIYVPPYALRI